MNTRILRIVVIFLIAIMASMSFPGDKKVLRLKDNRELFVDYYLIDKLDNLDLVMHEPRDEGPIFYFDKPWEGKFCGYATIIKDGNLYRIYYRGLPNAGKDYSTAEVTCYAESDDGITWRKPDLGLFKVNGSKKNNVILADAAPVTHNFSPFLDTNPDVPKHI